MKKRVLYSMMALVLSLTLVMATPAMAQEGHHGDKETDWEPTDGHPEDVYLVGQTVYFTITIINYEPDSVEIKELWDTIPVEYGTWDPMPGAMTYWWNSTLGDWVTGGDPGTSFTIPGEQSWNTAFDYTIREEDVTLHPVAGYFAVINRFDADGTQGESVFDTKTIRVIQPEIELDKTVAPSVAVVGQTVTYTFTITNTGDWPLVNITLVDDELGNLTTELPAGLVLGPGDSHSFGYDYTIQAGDLPLINEATVRGTAQGFNPQIFPEGDPPTAVVSDTDTARVSETPPVGGTAYPVNPLALLAPWIALGAAIIAAAVIFARRRQAQS